MPFYRNFPGRNFVNIKKDLDDFYEDFFGSRVNDAESMGKVHPLVNIEENENGFIVTAELPGVSKDEVKITFQDGNLCLSGKKKVDPDDKDKNFHRFERRYGSFSRSFSIPGKIKTESIEARFNEGILKIHLPKHEQSREEEIKINID